MTDMTTNDAFWDGFYREREQVWSGRPNDALVRETRDLTPGRALDLGCGEGADAIHLARLGWTVTAVDISRAALDRGAAQAAAEGLADRIDWQRHDLAASFPAGQYDLVSVQFLHSPVEIPRARILRRAAEAVAPGGTLLVEGHGGFPSWEPHDHPDVHFPSPDEVVADLRLTEGQWTEGQWEVLVSAEHERSQNAPDGRPTVRLDSTVKIRRRA